jgi:spore coat protein H
MKQHGKKIVVLAKCRVLAALLCTADAQAQSPTYNALYDPLNLTPINLEMDPLDWETIKADETRSIEKPAWFWGDDDSKMLVSVRRKTWEVTSPKFGIKIDINEYFDQNTWHGVKKLSLEADAEDVVSEGIAWYLHRAASTLPGDNYQPGLGTWANLTLNGENIGVFAHVEQPDKRFLRNRDLWTSGETWLYKQGDIGPPELDEGPSENSPTRTALNYAPFTGNTPPPAGYEAQLQNLIDMKGMLTLGAVNSFTTNEDELFTKGKNAWHADFESGKRMYFPWDLDAVFKSTNYTIYGSNTPYQQYILNNPIFRAQYNQVFLELLNGPMSVAELTNYLNQLEVELTPWLLNDPNSDVGDPAERFDELRSWMTARHANVLSQVQANMAAGNVVPEPSGAILSIVMLGALLRRQRRNERG